MGFPLMRTMRQASTVLPPGIRRRLSRLVKSAAGVGLQQAPVPMRSVHRGRETQSSGDIWADRHLDEHYWSGLIHWGQIPAVAAYMNRRISGDPSKDFIAYTHQKYLRPYRASRGRLRMLSLCSGVGQVEFQWLADGLVDEIVGYEVSKDCVVRANEEAAARGVADRIRFVQADLNTVQFPEGAEYDVILNEAALHHISNLEHLLGECRRHSHADTLFVSHDFVGPNHHQWTEEQLSLINRILSILPPELRASRTNPGAIHERKSSLPLKEMLRIDPTEAVRSQDIKPVMSRFFATVEEKDFGGTLLHMLLNDMAGNFMDPRWGPVVDLLVLFEETLLDAKVLTSDFSYWVSVPR